MKNLLTLLILLTTFNYALAEITIQGGTEFNVYSAHNEVKKTAEYKINPKKFLPHLIDKNKKENLVALLKGQVELKDRTLAKFSNGAYGIIYKDDPLHAYYYSKNGILEYTDIKTHTQYPYKSYQYDINGNLVNMGLRVSKYETFLYNTKNELIAHWIGENGYNADGKIIMTRKFFE